jgi:hypothetical protein
MRKGTPASGPAGRPPASSPGPHRTSYDRRIGSLDARNRRFQHFACAHLLLGNERRKAEGVVDLVFARGQH